MDPFSVHCCLTSEPECAVNLLGPNHACKSLVMLLMVVRVGWLAFSEHLIVTLLKHNTQGLYAAIKSPVFESIWRNKPFLDAQAYSRQEDPEQPARRSTMSGWA